MIRIPAIAQTGPLYSFVAAAAKAIAQVKVG